MKKLLFFLSLLISAVAFAQPSTPIPGYTNVNDRYIHLDLAPRGLSAPSSADTNLLAGKWRRAGAMLVDTTGNKGLFVRLDNTMQRLAFAGELSDSVDNRLTSVYRRNDSVFICINNACSFAFKDSTGGGGISFTTGEGLLMDDDDTLTVNKIDSLRLDTLQAKQRINGYGDSWMLGSQSNTNPIGGITAYTSLFLEIPFDNYGVNGITAGTAASAWLANTAIHRQPVVFWFGKNNLIANPSNAWTTTQTAINQLLGQLSSVGNNNYVFLGQWAGGGETTGTAVYDSIIAFNQHMAAIIPAGHFGDVFPYLYTKFDPGIPADVSGHAAGIVASSLRVTLDSFHLNNTGFYHASEFLATNFSTVLLDTAYKTYYPSANMLVRMLNGAATQINVGANGYQVNGQVVAWIPSRTLVGAGNLFLGGKSTTMTSAALNNTFGGINSGNALTSGVSNTGFGSGVLQVNTTGSQNTGVGRFVFINNVGGSGNTAVGNSAAQGNSSGNNNTAIGDQALAGNASGSSNVAVGRISLFTCNGCTQNVAIGTSAAVNATNGSNLSALGFEALRNNNTGLMNSAVGSAAGYFNTSGNGNFFGGWRAGWGAAGNGAINYNVMIGAGVGSALVAGVDSNIYIGANSILTTAASSDRNIVLGVNIELPSSSTRDFLSIGNVIYAANGNYGSGVTPFGTGTTAGTNYVGIGVSSPRERLDVDGQVSIRTVNAASNSSIDSLPVIEDGRVKALVGYFAQSESTPTLTNVANVASSTGSGMYWKKMGDKVSCTFVCSVTPTSGSTLTQLGVSLPVASNLANSYELRGYGTVSGVSIGFVLVSGDTTNDRAQLDFISTDTNPHTVTITIEYKII